MKLKIAAALSLSVALSASACGGVDDDEGTTDFETSASDDGLTAQAVSGLETTDPEAAAQAFVAGADPDSCRTRVKDAVDAHVVHVYLDHCTGRFGRKGHHVVSGEMLVTFSSSGDGVLHAHHESVTLTIDDRPATRVAEADIVLDGDSRQVVWHGETSTTDEDGDDVTRVADHVVDVDRATRCAVVNGTADVQRGDRQIHITLEGLTSCDAPDGGRYCPTGLIEADVSPRDVHITRTFDGTATAAVEITGPHGDRTRSIQLDCTPAGS